MENAPLLSAVTLPSSTGSECNQMSTVDPGTKLVPSTATSEPSTSTVASVVSSVSLIAVNVPFDVIDAAITSAPALFVARPIDVPPVPLPTSHRQHLNRPLKRLLLAR